MDASLRMKLEEINQTQSEAPVQCLAKITGLFDEQKEKALNDTGIRILNTFNDLISLEGSPEAIRKAAQLDFVHSISLSQTRLPSR